MQAVSSLIVGSMVGKAVSSPAVSSVVGRLGRHERHAVPAGKNSCRQHPPISLRLTQPVHPLKPHFAPTVSRMSQVIGCEAKMWTNACSVLQHDGVGRIMHAAGPAPQEARAKLTRTARNTDLRTRHPFQRYQKRWQRSSTVEQLERPIPDTSH